METEMRKLESLHVETTKLEVVKYVSLRDIIPNTNNNNNNNNNSNNGTPNQDSPVGFSYSTNISIKNRLVKHAASAYLQSAAVLANRNQNCLTQMWRRYVEGPVGACARLWCGRSGGLWRAWLARSRLIGGLFPSLEFSYDA
ncbi:hypothetical protein QJS10_CPA09g00636 [Acorus calamus]|uniref:Uncharacterized protein n=1 Tax=Acorus calamus TaxID=4465 RepID=A0AAV9E3L7_ACOCL|nr:hypothetical protein QJS10_CPA09g00636 [Acorus calamus]